MFRRLLLTLAREGDQRLTFSNLTPISNQIKEFNGQIPDDWSYPAGPIIIGNQFGFAPYGGPIIHPPPAPPPPPPDES